MNVKVLYFASLRETLGYCFENLRLKPGVVTAGDLRAYLAARGGAWSVLAEEGKVRVAVNQEMAPPNLELKQGDEVAFFPPVTGG